MAFEEPTYLLCAWGLLALTLGFWLSRRAADRAIRPLGSLPPDRRAGTPSPRRLYNALRYGLLLLAFAALVLALANPLRPRTRGAAPGPGPVELVFALDVSTSMLTADVLPDRLTVAKKFIDETTEGLRGEEVGVVVFAGNAQLALPLTADYDAVRAACRPLSPEDVPRQGTALAQALAHAALLFKSTRRTRIICLLSDGESHTPGHGAVADSLRSRSMIGSIRSSATVTSARSSAGSPDRNSGADRRSWPDRQSWSVTGSIPPGRERRRRTGRHRRGGRR